MSESNMRKLSTLKLPKIPERYELVDAEARRRLSGVEGITAELEGQFDTVVSTLTGDYIQFESLGGRSLNVVSILEPKQPGIGDPYLAGGGKNLWGYGDVIGTTSASILLETPLTTGIYTLSAVVTSGNVETTRSRVILIFKDGSTKNYYLDHGSERSYFSFNVEDTSVEKITFNASINGTESEGYEFNVLNIQIELGSIATEYAPYENIRPISGYDELNLIRCQKNLYPISWEQGAISDKTGNDNNSNSGVIRSNYIPVIPGKVYSVYRTISGSSFAVRCYDINKKYLGTGAYGIIPIKGYSSVNPMSKDMTSAVIQIREEVHYIRFLDYTDNLSTQAMIELSDEPTEFETFQGDLYSIPLGETVYGGKVDLAKGELSVDWVGLILNGTEFWQTNNSNGIYRHRIDLSNYSYEPGVHPIISDRYKSTDWGSHLKTLNTITLYRDSSWSYGRLTISTDMDAEAWKAYLAAQHAAGTPVQIAYKIPTPRVIKLNETLQIKSLQGLNTVYGGGTISVSTRGDLAEMADRLSEVESEVSTNSQKIDQTIQRSEITLSNHSDRLDEVEGYFDEGSTHSGSVVSFDSLVAGNAVEVTSVLEPKQTGSGDPYPAGGGKNICPGVIKNKAYQNSSGTLMTNQPSYACTEKIPVTPGVIYSESNSIGRETSKLEAHFWDSEDNWIGVVTGGLNNRPENAVYMALNYYVRDAGDTVEWVQVEVGNVATEYQPYSNIRPIIGWDKLELGVRGKNIFPAWAESSYTMNGVTFTKQADGSIRAQGTPTAYAYITLTDYKTLKEHGFTEGVHTISGLPEASNAWFVDLIGDANTQNINFYQNGSFNLSAEVKGNGTYAWRIVITPNMGAVDLIFKPQVEFGSAATPFAPYAGKLYTVQIGQTVCGGKLDWTTGKLTVDKAMVTLDGANQKATLMNVTSNYVQVKLGDYLPDARKHAGNGNLICSHLPEQYGLYSDFPYPHVFLDVIDTPYIRAYFSTTLASTVNEVNAYLAAQYAAGTPVQIAYKLATPKIIQLTPTQIKTLQGTNTFYGDGTLSVETKGEVLGVTDRVESIEQSLFDTKKYEYAGSVVQFDAPLEGSPMEAVTIIEPTQSGSGDPYPAGGGKNLFNITGNSAGVEVKADYSFNEDTGTCVLTKINEPLLWGQIVSNIDVSAYKGKKVTLSYTDYSITNIGHNPRLYILHSNGETVLSNIFFEENPNQKAFVFTLPTDTDNIIVLIRIDQLKTAPKGTVLTVNGLQLEIGETATAFQPYSNIRPFIGYDKLELSHAGKNLIPYYNLLSGYSDGGVTVTINADKTLTFSGTATRDAYFYLSIYSSTYTTGYVLPAGEYALSGCPAGGGTQSYRMALSLYKDGVWQEGGCTDYGSGGRFTIPEGHKVDLYIRFPSGTNANGATFKPMIRLASIADDTYEPYENTTYTIQIGQTVYGGRMDWDTGKLTDGIPPIEFDGDEVVSTDGGGIFTTSAFGAASAAYGEMWCSHYVVTRDYDSFMNTDMSVCVWASGQIRIHDSRFNTVAEINAEISAQKAAGTPVQIAYKLAEPFEIQLDKHDLTTLRGLNTVYCNAGETSISVRKDIFSLLGYLTQKNKELIDTIKELQS